MQILDTTSLAATLRNLEEARLDALPAEDPAAKESLDWILSRQQEVRGYGPFFAATREDSDERHPTLTGEHANRSCTLLTLGTEAARALWVWGRRGGWPAEDAVLRIRDKGRTWPPRRVGYICCEVCTVARWRALLAARPDGWETALAAGLQELAERPLQDGGGWRKFAFCYTLMALAEMDLPEAEAQRRRVRSAAERALAALGGNDAATRFRRRALKWAVGG